MIGPTHRVDRHRITSRPNDTRQVPKPSPPHADTRRNIGGHDHAFGNRVFVFVGLDDLKLKMGLPPWHVPVRYQADEKRPAGRPETCPARSPEPSFRVGTKAPRTSRDASCSLGAYFYYNEALGLFKEFARHSALRLCAPLIQRCLSNRNGVPKDAIPIRTPTDTCPGAPTSLLPSPSRDRAARRTPPQSVATSCASMPPRPRRSA